MNLEKKKSAMKKVWIMTKISPKFVPKGLIDNKSPLVKSLLGAKPKAIQIAVIHICYQASMGWHFEAETEWPPFSNAFSGMKIHEFLLRFQWSLFLRVQLTIFHHYTPAQRSWRGGYTGFTLLYLRPTKLEGGILDSPCPSVRPSVCRRHGFRSISQVCFGISVSNFMMHVDGGHRQKPIDFQRCHFQNGRLVAILDFLVSRL